MYLRSERITDRQLTLALGLQVGRGQRDLLGRCCSQKWWDAPDHSRKLPNSSRTRSRLRSRSSPLSLAPRWPALGLDYRRWAVDVEADCGGVPPAGAGLTAAITPPELPAVSAAGKVAVTSVRSQT